MWYKGHDYAGGARSGAAEGDRTLDLSLTKDALYH